MKRQSPNIMGSRAQRETSQRLQQCAACGTMGREHDIHCARCGARLRMVCVSCGEPVVQSSAFYCVRCGERLKGSER